MTDAAPTATDAVVTHLGVLVNAVDALRRVVRARAGRVQGCASGEWGRDGVAQTVHLDRRERAREDAELEDVRGRLNAVPADLADAALRIRDDDWRRCFMRHPSGALWLSWGASVAVRARSVRANVDALLRMADKLADVFSAAQSVGETLLDAGDALATAATSAVVTLRPANSGRTAKAQPLRINAPEARKPQFPQPNAESDARRMDQRMQAIAEHVDVRNATCSGWMKGADD
jgi:hypothetical protein